MTKLLYTKSLDLNKTRSERKSFLVSIFTTILITEAFINSVVILIKLVQVYLGITYDHITSIVVYDQIMRSGLFAFRIFFAIIWFLINYIILMNC